MRRILSLVSVALLVTACEGVASHQVNMVSMNGKKQVYSTTGLVLVPEMHEGVTKPYIEHEMRAVCPEGVKYNEFMEAFNKRIIVTGQVWMQWRALVECK